MTLAHSKSTKVCGRVRGLSVEGRKVECLAAASKGQYQMQRCATLKLVLCRRLLVGPILALANPTKTHIPRKYAHLLSAVDETLLRGWDAFLLLDALLYPRDLIGVSMYVLER